MVPFEFFHESGGSSWYFGIHLGNQAELLGRIAYKKGKGIFINRLPGGIYDFDLYVFLVYNFLFNNISKRQIIFLNSLSKGNIWLLKCNLKLLDNLCNLANIY